MSWQKVDDKELLLAIDETEVEVPPEVVEAIAKPRRGRPKKNDDSSSHDPVNSPNHYTAGGVETIDFIEAKKLNFHLGNVVKYVSRAGMKGQYVQDLEKAAWYLAREIERAKGE
jgi:hypothetical protein